MSAGLTRDLTSLEYVVLGLISIEPQSGYTIINYFEDGAYGWSASPGSVYPLLKRLEKQSYIAGELEMVHETRPRKMYSLTSLGEETLDEWLRVPPEAPALQDEREKAMWKFQFMGHRFSTAEVIQWLNGYEEKLEVWTKGRNIFRDTALAAMESEGIEQYRLYIHQQLLIELTIMEVNAQRTWVQLARARLESLPHQSGEAAE